MGEIHKVQDLANLSQGQEYYLEVNFQLIKLAAGTAVVVWDGNVRLKQDNSNKDTLFRHNSTTATDEHRLGNNDEEHEGTNGMVKTRQPRGTHWGRQRGA